MNLTVTGIAEQNGVKNVSFSANNPKTKFWLETEALKRWAQIQQNSAPVGSIVVAYADGIWYYADITDNVEIGETITMTEFGGGSPDLS